MKNPIDEQLIIELIREGKANKEIVVKIHKSLSTVRGRISMLMKKYNCKNRVQLALMSSGKVNKP